MQADTCALHSGDIHKQHSDAEVVTAIAQADRFSSDNRDMPRAIAARL